MGWAETTDGEVKYTNSAEVTNLTSDVSGNVTLYAVWEQNPYTVKFDKNTGTGTMEDLDLTYDESAIALPKKLAITLLISCLSPNTIISPFSREPAS